MSSVVLAKENAICFNLIEVREINTMLPDCHVFVLSKNVCFAIHPLYGYVGKTCVCVPKSVIFGDFIGQFLKMRFYMKLNFLQFTGKLIILSV